MDRVKLNSTSVCCAVLSINGMEDSAVNISFPNPAHVAKVWVPELMPTHMTVLSMIIALIFCALLLTGVAAMFFVFCLERAFSWTRTLATFAVFAVLFVGGGVLTNQLIGTNAVRGQLAALTKTGALANAKKAAIPSYAWRERAKQVDAKGHPVQKGWSDEDMHRVSLVVEQAKGIKPVKGYSRMVIATTPMTDAQIALTGSSYRDGAKTERCAVMLSNVAMNNVGQPVSAQISSLKCVPAP